MNRRQRRAAIARAVESPDARVPVFGPNDHIVALIAPAEVRRYQDAPNARVVRVKKTGQVVRINLKTLSDDTSMVVHRGNPRRYSFDHETETNPANVWTLRRLGSNDPEDEAFVQRVFRASVLDNLKAA